MSSSRKVLLTIVSSILIVSALTFTFVWFLVGDAYTQEAPPAERDVPPGAHLYVLSPTDGKVIFYKAFLHDYDIRRDSGPGTPPEVRWYHNGHYEHLLVSSGIILIVCEPLELDSGNRVVAHPPQKK